MPIFDQAAKGLQMWEFNNRHLDLITYSLIYDLFLLSEIIENNAKTK